MALQRAAARSLTADRTSWRAAGLLSIALACWCSIAWAARWMPTSVDLQIPQVARALSAGLFLTAGVLGLARWRLTGDGRTARRASAWILLGAALPLVSLIGPLMQQQPPGSARAVPVVRLLLLVPVLVLIATGSRSSRDRVVRPLPLIVVLFAAWAVAATALAELQPAAMLLPLVWLGAEYAVGATWMLFVVRTWRDGRGHAYPRDSWLAVAMLLMAVCELLKAHSIADPPTTFGLSPGLQLLAAGVIALTSAAELRDSHRLDGGRSLVLAKALLDAQRQLAKTQQMYRERLHDARSAVIGVVGASHLLSQPTALAVPDPQRLHELMAAELGRLQETLDTDSVEPIGEFALIDVLEPVVLAHRLAGGVIDVELGVVRVVGRPTATATVVANLLANARVHAPGARVDLRTDRQGSNVVLVVDDDGAGIPERDRQRVLLPGERGSTQSAGSGIGLYTAASAMADQAGMLHLTESPSGGTRAVVTLPAARHASFVHADPIRVQGC